MRLHAYVTNGFTRLDEIYMVDPSNGLLVPRPGRKFGRISINSLGFRGPEVPVAKPAGTLRFAFLGASTTFCADVSSDSKTWPDLVVRELTRRFPAHPLDYVNAAVPGYGIKEMMASLKLRVLPAHPNVVIIYEATNDLSKDTYKLALERRAIEERSPWSRWLTDRSRLAQLIHMNAAIWAISQQDREGGRMTLELNPDTLAALRSSYRDRMTALIRAAQRSVPVVAVATFSHRVRYENAPKEGTAEAAWVLYKSRADHLTVKGLLDAYDAYNAAIRDAAEASGVVLIDGDTEIPGDAVHFVDTMHFSDAGSEAMARRVVRTLAAAEPFRRLVSIAEGGQPLGR